MDDTMFLLGWLCCEKVFSESSYDEKNELSILFL